MQVFLNKGVKYTFKNGVEEGFITYDKTTNRFEDIGTDWEKTHLEDIGKVISEMKVRFPSIAWGVFNKALVYNLTRMLMFVTWEDIPSFWENLPEEYKQVVSKMMLGYLLAEDGQAIENLISVCQEKLPTLNQNLINQVDAHPLVIIKILLSKHTEDDHYKPALSHNCVYDDTASYGWVECSDDKLYLTLVDSLTQQKIILLSQDITFSTVQQLVEDYVKLNVYKDPRNSNFYIIFKDHSVKLVTLVSELREEISSGQVIAFIK